MWREKVVFLDVENQWRRWMDGEDGWIERVEVSVWNRREAGSRISPVKYAISKIIPATRVLFLTKMPESLPRKIFCDKSAYVLYDGRTIIQGVFL